MERYEARRWKTTGYVAATARSCARSLWMDGAARAGDQQHFDSGGLADCRRRGSDDAVGCVGGGFCRSVTSSG